VNHSITPSTLYKVYTKSILSYNTLTYLTINRDVLRNDRRVTGLGGSYGGTIFAVCRIYSWTRPYLSSLEGFLPFIQALPANSAMLPPLNREPCLLNTFPIITKQQPNLRHYEVRETEIIVRPQRNYSVFFKSV
jgi:hypothetical protein